MHSEVVSQSTNDAMKDAIELPDLMSDVSDVDIYRAAKILVDLYGDDAGIRAALRCDHFFEGGDLEGSKVWKRIVDAIKVLQNFETPHALN